MASLRDELVSCGAVKFGDFTLTSGKKSKYYVDVKQATTLPRILKQIADALAPKVADAEVLAGVELGAVPILVAVALATGKPYAIIRKGERSHGTGKRIEGQPVKGKRVLIIEDVTTTGQSVVNAVQLLREDGATVGRVETVVDRGEGGAQALQALDVRLGALVSAQDLLAMSAGGARA
jgi:orotate phosphoribosyltransferase